MLKNFQFHLRTKVVYGENQSLKLAEHIPSGAGSPKAVIVTDQGLVNLGYIQPIADALSKEGVEVTIYSDVKSNPTFQNINEAAELLKKTGSSAVIGIGGGSPLDTAKTAALVAGGDQEAGHYALMANPFPPKKVVTIAIPTTAGTGAEVTSTTVYSDENHRKLWAWDQEMQPEIAILDPVLTVDLPDFLTAATGIDALVHALEALTGQATSPVIEAAGLHAIRLVAENLPAALENKGNLEARGNLLTASMLAGVAIEQGGTGIAHNLGHALSTVGGLHHGRAVAIALYHAYEWNLESPRISEFAKAARAFGASGEFGSDAELAKEGARLCRSLIESCPIDLEVGIDGLTMKDQQALFTASLAEENRPMRVNNCRYASDEDLQMLVEQILSHKTAPNYV
ncbi:iron-containing alcohol dehydrogenase [Bacillus mangrovi]|uniref:Iron-containing alcohol dehydrogenase n=1 Tax=Metabacillus mangrovi TaxID=1491830 RepID=A0A7X2S1G3_9BACI|nr:iron-containing alcohol dehydrogenase [Metabacillus mangrovi]MTH51905.1 iron-containing alcohol dehydrogenase [Metabacillus mangrovi]